MPATPNEVTTMLGVFLKHTPPESLRQISEELWETVGQTTDNASLKATLAEVLRQSQPPAIPFKSRALLGSVIALHWLIIAGDLFAFFYLIGWSFGLVGLCAWCVSLPILHFIVWIVTSRIADCPLTSLENSVRTRIGLPTIRGFVKHYLRLFAASVSRLRAS